LARHSSASWNPAFVPNRQEPDSSLRWNDEHTSTRAKKKRAVAGPLALLERIDRASLAAKRRVTVPFLRGLLESGGGG